MSKKEIKQQIDLITHNNIQLTSFFMSNLVQDPNDHSKNKWYINL